MTGRAAGLALALLASAGIGAASLGLVRPAVAQQAAEHDFAIPAQPLSAALVAFSNATGLQIFFDERLVSGRTSQAVDGSMAAGEALTRLLAGTGLAYGFTNPTTVTILGADPGAADGDSLLLDAVEVTAASAGAHSGSGYLGTPDWVYEDPSGLSVISREAIADSPIRNTRDLLDAVAGVYANRSEAQNPGISVNIRGLQDQDRIVMMIDGARQSFQRSGHGSTQRTFVDTAFLRTVDIEKASTAGVGSLGSLGGSVNFRTLVADDLIPAGEKWGGELNATTGTNEYNFDGSFVVAVRPFEALAITAGISQKSIGAYEIGQDGEVFQDTTYDGDIMLFSGQDVLGTFLKVEIEPFEDLSLSFGWLRNETDFSTGYYDYLLTDGDLFKLKQSVVSETLTAALDWNPDSDWIDLEGRLYYTHVDNDDYGVVIEGQPRSFSMATLGGSLQNTSRFETGFGLLSLTYGGEAFRDRAKTKVPSYYVNGDDISDQFVAGVPSGERKAAGGFLTATFEQGDWLLLRGGLRYDWYRISGSGTIWGNETAIWHEPSNCLRYYPSPPRPPNECRTWGTPGWWEVIPRQPYDLKVDRSESALLPSFTLAVKPFDWLQPFVGYSKSFRPPTVMESFMPSAHANERGTWSPNPYLDPERAETWEIGANIMADGLLWADDALRLKVVGFYREVEDYIAIGRTYIPETDRPYNSPVNLNATTYMKGLEIEASYDARTWYLGGSFTWNETNWADTYTAHNGYDGVVGPQTPVIFVQPARRLVLDGGVRLFGESLTLGARMNKVGPSKPEIGTLADTGNYTLEGYTTFDVYASYTFDEHVKLRAAVTNLTDKAYVSATGVSYYAAPGLTATVSLQVKF